MSNTSVFTPHASSRSAEYAIDPEWSPFVSFMLTCITHAVLLIIGSILKAVAYLTKERTPLDMSVKEFTFLFRLQSKQFYIWFCVAVVVQGITSGINPLSWKLIPTEIRPVVTSQVISSPTSYLVNITGNGHLKEMEFKTDERPTILTAALAWNWLGYPATVETISPRFPLPNGMKCDTSNAAMAKDADVMDRSGKANAWSQYSVDDYRPGVAGKITSIDATVENIQGFIKLQNGFTPIELRDLPKVFPGEKNLKSKLVGNSMNFLHQWLVQTSCTGKDNAFWINHAVYHPGPTNEFYEIGSASGMDTLQSGGQAKLNPVSAIIFPASHGNRFTTYIKFPGGVGLHVSGILAAPEVGMDWEPFEGLRLVPSDPYDVCTSAKTREVIGKYGKQTIYALNNFGGNLDVAVCKDYNSGFIQQNPPLAPTLYLSVSCDQHTDSDIDLKAGIMLQVMSARGGNNSVGVTAVHPAPGMSTHAATLVEQDKSLMDVASIHNAFENMDLIGNVPDAQLQGTLLAAMGRSFTQSCTRMLPKLILSRKLVATWITVVAIAAACVVVGLIVPKSPYTVSLVQLLFMCNSKESKPVWEGIWVKPSLVTEGGIVVTTSQTDAFPSELPSAKPAARPASPKPVIDFLA